MKNRNVYIGAGFHSDVDTAEIERAIRTFLEELGIEPGEVRGLCTMDFERSKKLDEISARLGVPLFRFSRAEINSVEDVRSKSAAQTALNLKGVAEPCAILGAITNGVEYKHRRRKSFYKRITLAVVFS